MSRTYAYLVPDDHPDDEYVNTFDVECLGSLDMNAFYDLQVKGVFADEHDYYDMYRYKLVDIERMRNVLADKGLTDTEPGKQVELWLLDAIEMKQGIYFECEVVS